MWRLNRKNSARLQVLVFPARKCDLGVGMGLKIVQYRDIMDTPSPNPNELRAAILRVFPQFRNSKFTILTHSWDSVAVDVDDAMICKFPRNEKAALALHKEARLLAVIGPAVTMRVPVMTLHEDETLFSSHDKLRGEHLENFADLAEAAQVNLGAELGRFYAELHSLDRATMSTNGAKDLPHWGSSTDILTKINRVLPEHLLSYAEKTTADWDALPPDPHGITYGFFDGHGWNMAFDHTRQKLIGMYDFADSGFAPVHQEFIYSSLTSPDLTVYIIDAYERCSGRKLDRNRISILTGMHRLWELAGYAGDAKLVAMKLRDIQAWAVESQKPRWNGNWSW
jgi:aminoglycoside phosphotransferase (APT) family kinase protein